MSGFAHLCDDRCMSNEDAIAAVKRLGLSPTIECGLLGYIVQRAAGLTPELAKATRARYHKLMCAAGLSSMVSSLSRRAYIKGGLRPV